MEPVGVALIGGGLFAKQSHMGASIQPAIMACDSLSLKAIYSRSLKSAQDTLSLYTKAEKTPDLYSADSGAGNTYHDLLLRDDIVGVIVALPIVSQPEYVEAALAAGKHVLAEKPVAPDVAAAKRLISFYRDVSANNGATLAVAENVRFMPSFTYAAQQAKSLGVLNHFSIRVFSLMKKDVKWLGTEWRRKPEYQGGFLLDGGVHHAAAARRFLAGDSKPEEVRALTSLVQDYLPPIDTVNAMIKTKAGASGAFQVSVGSQMTAFEWHFGFDWGSISIVGDTVTVKTADGEEAVKEFPRSSGVSEEVEAWAQSLVAGTPDPLQSPEEALADLEFMEKMFKSGEQGGIPLKYELQ